MTKSGSDSAINRNRKPDDGWQMAESEVGRLVLINISLINIGVIAYE